MNTTNDTQSTIHIKVIYNNEFRRFSLDAANFNSLERTIRDVYSLPDSEKVHICYFDDEQDKVALSTDQDLIYALALTKQPLRLFVTLVSSTPSPADETLSSIPFPVETTEVTTERWASGGRPCGRGRGRGRKGKCWGEGKAKWREEKQFLTLEERRQKKIERITARIEKLESVLLTDIPANRDRTLAWKVENLKAKLEYLKSPPPPDARDDRGEETPRRGGRGRGGHNSRGGKVDREDSPASTETDHIRENLLTARRNLRAAYQSGDAQEVQKCTLALEEAKFEKKEAKRKLKGENPNRTEKPLWAEKNRKHECLKNLRAARASGDKAKIEECESALIEAKEALMKAKLEAKC